MKHELDLLNLCGVISAFALLMIAGYSAERADRKGVKDCFMLSAWFVLLIGLVGAIWGIVFVPGSEVP